jgi:hypothetical protein
MDDDEESPRLTPIDKSRGYLGADNLISGSPLRARMDEKALI